MQKLSRKDRYQDLRTSNEPAETTDQSSQSAQPSGRTFRQAAPDSKSELRKKAASKPAQAQSTNPVLEDLLGEVTQYNLSNGDLVTEDTQMQILHDLSESKSSSSKRNRHLEEMEKNESIGGTTRNLYASDLSDLASKAAAKKAAEKSAPAHTEEDLDLGIFEPEKPQPAAKSEPESGEKEITADEIHELIRKTKAPNSLFKRKKPKHENFITPASAMAEEEEAVPAEEADLIEEEIILTVPKAGMKNFKSNAAPIITEDDEVTEPEEQDEEEEEELTREEKKALRAKRKAEKKAARQSRKAAAVAEDDEAFEDEDDEDLFPIHTHAHTENLDEEDQPISKGAAIFMIICVVILVILIILTIFWMSKLGIF